MGNLNLTYQGGGAITILGGFQDLTAQSPEQTWSEFSANAAFEQKAGLYDFLRSLSTQIILLF